MAKYISIPETTPPGAAIVHFHIDCPRLPGRGVKNPVECRWGSYHDCTLPAGLQVAVSDTSSLEEQIAANIKMLTCPDGKVYGIRR